MSSLFSDHYNAAHDLLGRNLTPARRNLVAYIDKHGSHTYAQLSERAGRFAGALRALSVLSEQRVALCLSDTIDFPATFLGAIQHGAVPIPLNTRLTTKDYTYILADSRTTALVVSADLYPRFAPALSQLPHLNHVILSGGIAEGHLTLDELLAQAEPSTDFADTRRDDMCFWLYTSGTTGQPKGVVHAQDHLIQTAHLYAIPILGLVAEDVVYSAAKLYFAYGLGNALTFPMAVGATTILLEGPPTPAAIGHVFREHQPTVFYGVPTLYGMLLANKDLLPDKDALTLRACTSAGEALPPELLRRWRERTGVEILDGLGSTEGLHIFLSNRTGDVRPGASGRPVPGYALRIVDDDGQPVPVGEMGSLEVSGPTTAMMYWNQRSKTKRVFRGPWMRTGDKYRQDEEGYFYYEGRSDDLMKVGGIWVSPFEVESTLIEHDAVQECAVVAHPDHDGLIKPKAFVVLAAGHAPSDDLAAALKDFVKQRLAPFKRPRWVAFLDELPKTATGKIQRYKLRID
ncbi:MAG: benzoate-CoA ligase family protein [Myxococcota bacterium]